MGAHVKVNANLVRPLTLLGLLFIVLKMTDTIDWSWLWVLAPFWILPAFIALIVALAMLLVVIAALLK